MCILYGCIYTAAWCILWAEVYIIMSTTEAQRRASARYQAKLATITLRASPDRVQALRDAADVAGESLNKYVIGAAEARRAADADGDRMAHGTQPQATEDGDRIRLSLRADAVQGLERDGETPAQAAARLLADAIRQARQDT